MKFALFAPMKLAVLAALVGLAGTAPAANTTAAKAAEEAATTARECTSIGDFYWEIGDRNGVLASGQVGSEYDANSEMKIASASKWVWGAYVLQKLGDKSPSDEQVAMLEMRSGYTAFNPVRCLLSGSVQGCLLARGNDERESASVGKFSYGGGHSQKLAASLGLGRMDADELTTEVKRYLGPELGFSFAQPQPAGGMKSTPAQYGQFLRKILSGDLRMRGFLGYKPVCTLPRVCAGALSSPAKEAWHYSLNHWVEDDPQTGDGAYSSPGLMGFYPWISADKSTYGLLARQQLRASAYWDSVRCGREIRRAWMKNR